MYQYLVQCWIKPQSGFDLARKNKIMSMFKDLMTDFFPNSEDIENAVEGFEEESQGYVLEPFVLETDEEVTDGERDLLPEILKNHPEAKLLTWEKVPQFVQNSGKNSTN